MNKSNFTQVAVVAVLLGLAAGIGLWGYRDHKKSAAALADLTAQFESCKTNLACCTVERNKLRLDLDAMTKRYLEESAENSAISSYLANIPRKMNFAHPFDFKLREKINKERILPVGIYIRDGQYDDFEVGDTVVDQDTMAFAKLSGCRIEETPEAEIVGYMADLEKRIDADLKATPYPFKVTRRVWNDNGIVCFEIVDTEMYEKMEKRMAKSRDESVNLMKQFRDK